MPSSNCIATWSATWQGYTIWIHGLSIWAFEKLDHNEKDKKLVSFHVTSVLTLFWIQKIKTSFSITWNIPVGKICICSLYKFYIIERTYLLFVLKTSCQQFEIVETLFCFCLNTKNYHFIIFRDRKKNRWSACITLKKTTRNVLRETGFWVPAMREANC